MRLKLPLLVLFVSVSINLGTAKAQQGVFYLPGNAPSVVGLPQCNQSFDDLDPRDSQNQTINTSFAQNELQQIFTGGLYGLFLSNKIYTSNEIASLLANAIKTGRDFITKEIPVFVGTCVYAILPFEKKKFLKLFCALPGFLIFPIIIIFGINANLIQAVPTSNKALLVLRC
jgi:hypothetical protein